MKMMSHDLLIDGIEDFEPLFPCADEIPILQNREMMRREILGEIEMLPDFTDASFSFLQETEDAQAILVTDRSHE